MSVRLDSRDVDVDLDWRKLMKWVNTTWVPKEGVDLSQPITVSGGGFLPEINVTTFKSGPSIPMTQEIFDDNVEVARAMNKMIFRGLTHDQHVELVQHLNDDQLALVIYRVAQQLKEQEITISELTGQIKRVKKTARKMLGVKKTTNPEDILELLDLPIPNEW